MKSIYLIVVIYLIISCNSQTENKTSENQNSELSIVIDSRTNQDESLTNTESDAEILDLPVIGTFELNSMKLDSLNEYGAGDCWGTIRRYSLSNVGLVIDSMTCGEYGYTYTYYLLSAKNFIQVVYTKKSESILDPEKNSYFYVQQEQVIDYNSNPVIKMTRIDTLNDYNQRQNQIDKKFVTDTIKDKQTTYKHFEMEYIGTWEMKLY